MYVAVGVTEHFVVLVKTMLFIPVTSGFPMAVAFPKMSILLLKEGDAQAIENGVPPLIVHVIVCGVAPIRDVLSTC